ncbi:MAG: hypothetical protein EOO38_00060 [Cytophagaceae bacterium]|nr:MAG: hypothetical protein EOO38_00060 [Cytophagaceae bacterium]
MKFERIRPTKTERGTYTFTVQDAEGRAREFEAQKYGALEATDTLLDLMSIGGEAIGSATANTEQGQSVMQALMKSLSSKLKADKRLAKDLLEKLSSSRIVCDGCNIDFDKFYADDLMLCFKAAYGNIEVQFANFFSSAGKLLGTSEKDKLQAATTT